MLYFEFLQYINTWLSTGLLWVNLLSWVSIFMDKQVVRCLSINEFVALLLTHDFSCYIF